MAEELGWSQKAFREAFEEALAKGLVKADWKARLVWLPNACKYNPPESPNVVKSWRIPWDETPECSLKNEAFNGLKAFIEGLGEGFRKAFSQALAKGMPNQEQEPEQDQDPDLTPPQAAESVSSSQLTIIASGSGSEQPPCQAEPKDAEKIRAVFAHYRAHHPKALPSPAPTGKEWKLVRDRLRDGYTVDTLCKAIDGYHKSPHHLGENESNTEYLSLALFMRDASHVDAGVRFDDAKDKPVMSVREMRSQRAGQGFLAKLDALGMGGKPDGPG